MQLKQTFRTSACWCLTKPIRCSTRLAHQRFLSLVHQIFSGLFTATASEKVQALIQELFSKRIRHGPSSSRFILKTVNFPCTEETLSRSRGNPRRTGRRRALLFTNTANNAMLAEELKENGYDCAVYRGDMDKLERRQNLRRSGTAISNTHFH